MQITIAVPATAMCIASAGGVRPVVMFDPLKYIDKQWHKYVMDSITIIGSVAASRIAAYTSRDKVAHGIGTSGTRHRAGFLLSTERKNHAYQCST